MEDNLLNVTKISTLGGYLKLYHGNLLEEFGDYLYTDMLLVATDDKLAKMDLKEYEEKLTKDKKGIYKDFMAKSEKNHWQNEYLFNL